MASKKGLTLLLLLMISSMLISCQGNNDKTAGDNKETETKNVNKENLTADDKVATINGMDHTYADLKYSELMSKVEIELNRLQDEKTLEGDKLKDKLAYWDEQINYHDNYNVNLSKMIELYSMYLLAQEKGLRVDKQQLQETIEDFNQRVEQCGPAQKLIAESPAGEYENRLETYFTQRLLSEEIFNILKEDMKKEKPDASEQEIAYLANQKYEELYQSQIESVEIQIH